MKALTSFIAMALILSSCLQASAQPGKPFHVAKTLSIGGTGGWDYLAVPPGSNNLYVSHSTQVNIINKQTGDSIGVIPNTTGVHGIAFIPSLNKGYTSNGRLNTVTVFDLSTGAPLLQIATGENPDAILYEDFSKMIITCNGRSKDLSVIDPATNTVISTIDVGGKPETAVSDGKGKLYVNIEDKNEIVMIDMSTKTVQAHWPLKGAEAPTGLAIDRKSRRLFAGCEKQLVVLNADNGNVIDQLPIGDGCDGVAFDNGTKTIFTSNGADGTMTIIQELSADTYAIKSTLNTRKGGRTIAIDESTHTLYIPTALFEPAGNDGKRPAAIPGSFGVMVIAQ
jgi:YVTN family beta-propeller protein